MLTAYKALLNYDQLEWLAEKPKATSQPVEVIVLFVPKKRARRRNSQKLAAILEAMAQQGGVSSIPDPLAWQRQMREERSLPGREL